MPAVQYPFIDIAVHERVREKFAGGEAMALFSMDLTAALWANGRGAALFGTPLIYDFLERGPSRQDVTFRQLAGAASRLQHPGDRQSFTIRVLSGFRSIAVPAIAEVIEAESGQPAVLFSAALDQSALSLKARAQRMIEGFDDADIHMAVLDGNSEIIAASDGFAVLGITPQTTRTLVSMASRHPGKLVKRPVPAGKGYLPAATGQLSQNPALNLLFVVETVLGTLDPSHDFAEPVAERQAVVAPADEIVEPSSTSSEQKYASVLDAVAEIEEVAEPDEIDAELDTAGSTETSHIQPAMSQPIAEMEEESQPEDEAAAAVEEDATPFTGEAEPAAALEADAPEDEEPELPLETQPFASAADQSPPEPETDQTSSVEAIDFVFNPNGRASRFVWKIDSTGHFSSISHEFAGAVGPKAAAVEGMSFADLAALFNLDPDGKITELLNRRDTWSGKTIFWPVEGTSLVVPIDLAALPTYTRTREFDGFRGFGIVRIADAVEDPNAVGLALSGGGKISEEVQELSEVQRAEDETMLFSLPDDEEQLTTHAQEELLDAADIHTPDEAKPGKQEPTRSYEPPEHEVPALKITETPGRRYSDKVVQFDEHRARNRDGLSASEQAAFQEIGRALKPADTSGETPKAAEESATSSETKVTDGITAPVETEAATEPFVEDDATEDTTDTAVEPFLKNSGATAEPVTNATATELEAETVSEAELSVDTTGDIDEDAFADYTRGDELVAFTHLTAANRETGDLDDGAEEATPEHGPTLKTPGARFSANLTAETIDQMPVALLIHSGDRLIHANPEFLRLTGYVSTQDLEEVGGLDALLQRDELEAATDRTGGMIAVTAENDLVPVRAKLQSVHWEDTSALMLSLIPTEANIAASEDVETSTDDAGVSQMRGEIEELHSILETATDGVVLLGEDGTIRSLNRSASALFNYDNREIANKPFVTLFAHESQRAVLDYLSGLANNGVASVLNDGREVIGREASGGFLPLFMTIGRLKSTNGYCAVIRDITQWKRTEEDLRNAKRAAETANAHKTDFLARVSHEIRTPLNAIIGFADMMATERFGPVGNPRYIEYSNDIVRSGRHVLDIVNDLLDISKIEAGQMDVDFKAVALNETIAEAVSIVQPQANNQRVIIRTALSQSVPQIVADLRSIKQIMLNILSNAIKFTPSGGQIVVSTAYEPNGSVTLRIRDTGIGMTRSELEQAMKPFRQVSASSSRVRGDGTGLGLPLTKAMVDANRANFAITSTPNEGTLVEISFPSQRVLAN
ncbi:PAS domain-containing sensor histidine kinase [Agrobacterium larrymoorei]|uniref:PAS domain-containing sensor histidine kinase n=1 Tax=Agrobacterium larrymoorei TaxID=160699 RepID=UPI0015724522|nr:PAS domain-containing sensor histidine kinase [Agrobacterium larrymoorei]NTJ41414.1 PAS domain-containing sensor histidine kinase [Agrobacterium larrymoorei]